MRFDLTLAPPLGPSPLAERGTTRSGFSLIWTGWQSGNSGDDSRVTGTRVSVDRSAASNALFKTLKQTQNYNSQKRPDLHDGDYRTCVLRLSRGVCHPLQARVETIRGQTGRHVPQRAPGWILGSTVRHDKTPIEGWHGMESVSESPTTGRLTGRDACATRFEWLQVNVALTTATWCQVTPPKASWVRAREDLRRA